METQQLLKDYSDQEKGAYLTAIASIASADRSASEEELDYLKLLSQEANLSGDQKDAVMLAAQETNDTNLRSSLDELKNSELKFSLVTDLLSFAKSDTNYSDEERTKIEGVANYLDIDQNQYEALNQFVDKTATSNVNPEEVTNPDFLSSLGLEDKFKSAGLNMGSIGKGLLGILAPLILSKLMGSRSGSTGMGGLGGGLGGLLSGLGGSGSGGGLGSLISILSGGRGLGSAGGLLSKIL
ncbi:MAG TPA: TerB family tellurite resistance protein [Sphingobacteriaceae bacterium]|nr:TerB family tellurite resistance protein [Sphingobacteriaceae bacterium]